MRTKAQFSAASHQDASEQESALQGWHQRYMQVEPGRFRGATATASFGGVAVTEERLNVGVMQASAPPSGTLALIVHPGAGQSRINGQPQSAELFLHRGGVLLDLACSSGPNCAYYVVVDEAMLPESDLRALAPISPVTGYSGGADLAQWLSSLIAITPDNLRRTPGAMETVVPAMLKDRVAEICSHVVHGGTIPQVRESYAYSLFKRARRRVEEDQDHTLSVTDLATELGVPVHVLRSAFISTTGEGPSQWMRQRRLDHARRAILRQDGAPKNVAQIAMEAGFFHFGRFAAYYAEKFHETPIETIRTLIS